MAPTPEQVAIVKSTAPIVKEHGEAITQVFYRNLLADHPQLHNYFSVRNQATGAQQAALAGAVFAYAAHVDNLPALAGAVEKIAHKHASLFVQPAHYPIVGEYLLGAFAEVLGAGLTPAVAGAWREAYAALAQVFINAEAGLYGGAGAWQDWRPFVLARKRAEADGVASFWLAPADGQPLPPFVPGQYVSVQVALPALGGLLQSRQFSLSSGAVEGGSGGEGGGESGNGNCYRITVKKENVGDRYSAEDMASGKEPGLVSSVLHDQLAIGDTVHLSPPRGVFRLVDGSGPVVLLSAGVGASPMMSLLEAVLPSAASSSRPVTWAHGARSSQAVCYGEYVRELASKHANVAPRIFVKDVRPGAAKGRDYDEQGRLSVDALKRDGSLHLGDATAQYYICGPEAFMLQLQEALKAEGVDDDRIHFELFRTGSL